MRFIECLLVYIRRAHVVCEQVGDFMIGVGYMYVDLDLYIDIGGDDA